MRPQSILKKCFNSRVPAAITSDDTLKIAFEDALPKIFSFMEGMEFNRALDEIWAVINLTNEYVEQTAPWRLAKDEQQRDKLSTVIFNIYESLRLISLLVAPFIPHTAESIWRQLGLNYTSETLLYDNELIWGKFPVGSEVQKGAPLFPRKETD